MTSQTRVEREKACPDNNLQNNESEAFPMLTVLFVLAVLCGAYMLLSAIDGHYADSREVGSYLRTEYKASSLTSLY